MSKSKLTLRWTHGLYLSVAALAVVAGSKYFLFPGASRPNKLYAGDTAPARAEIPVAHVEVVQPQAGELDRLTTQPGTVQAYESVNLYAEVSGYLKTLNDLDIGSKVKRGEVLAVIDVPELDKQVQRDAAMLDQARAKEIQAQARVDTAEAEMEAAQAAVIQAQTVARSKAALLRYREAQHRRYKELADLKSIDDRLFDEQTEQRDAAQEGEAAARAAIKTTEANVKAASARIKQAKADVIEAEAEVKVAQANLEKSKVLVNFATIRAPFDGVISQRNVFPNDFIQSATAGGVNRLPLLTVQRTDRLRVVVQVPDRDVPFANPGDSAIVEIDALPGEKFTGTISRVANSEDASTRNMRVEVDLPSQGGRICNGMYGRVKIVLEKSKMLAIPSSCLVGKSENGKADVFVVRKSVARLVPVTVGGDNGLKVGIVSGLTAEDKIVLHPGVGIHDGVAVVSALPPINTAQRAEH